MEDKRISTQPSTLKDEIFSQNLKAQNNRNTWTMTTISHLQREVSKLHKCTGNIYFTTRQGYS